MIGRSELLGPAEVILEPQGTYTTPSLFAAYSDRGLDGISEDFYSWFRSRPHHVLPTAGGGKPRLVVPNTWEAVYFDHNLPTLIELADSAVELGVERFVLDDGWFRGRREDHAGLGDWYVDEALSPGGLTPLIDAVTSRGMEFGLWVEPEMELKKSHPGVEIESCSSGGARVNLGILERTDRIWASDCNDALERQSIQRWTGLVVPPELVGGHIGPTTSHTTARTHDASFRATTALFGHFGMEWDVRQVAGAEREELKRFIALFK